MNKKPAKSGLFIGFAVLLMTAMFTLAGCGNSTTDPGPNPNNEGTPDTSGTGWPPSSVLSQYDIAGMPAPAGASGITWGISNGTLFVFYTADTTVQSWLTNNGWAYDMFAAGYKKAGSSRTVHLYTEEGEKVLQVL